MAAVVSILAIGHNGFPAVYSTGCICSPALVTGTVEPRSTDTRFIRTISFVPAESSYIFSKINPALYRHLVIRTTDTFLCPESQTLIYCQRRFTDTGYPHTVYFYCHNYVIIVDLVPCSNNDRFLGVNKILLQICAKKT